MHDKQYLLIPGPTPLPPAVLRELSRPMINHRGPEFAARYRKVLEGLKPLFGTQHPVTMLTCSGTGGLEAATVNTVSPGDRVLAIVTGVFGARWAAIAERYGAQVERMEFPAGHAADPDVITHRLEGAPEVSAVLLTHNETSTGIMNDVEAIAAAIKGNSKALLLLDAVSSLGAVPVEMDRWGVDAVVTASQKALMNPPGLAFVALSPRAWEAVERATTPRFYFDFRMARQFDQKSQTPWTPAVSVLFGIDAALDMIREEGLPAVFRRHENLALAARAGCRALGLEPLAGDRCYSRTVTAVKVPEGLDVQELRKRLRLKHNVIIAGGQKELEGKIFRIGHLGFVDQYDILAALSAIEEESRGLGMSVKLGAASEAACVATAGHACLEVGM